MLFTLRQTTIQSGPNFPACSESSSIVVHSKMGYPELTATVAESMPASESLNLFNWDSPLRRTKYKRGWFLETAADSSLSCCFNINPSGFQNQNWDDKQGCWTTHSFAQVQLISMCNCCCCSLCGSELIPIDLWWKWAAFCACNPTPVLWHMLLLFSKPNSKGATLRSTIGQTLF